MSEKICFYCKKPFDASPSARVMTPCPACKARMEKGIVIHGVVKAPVFDGQPEACHDNTGVAQYLSGRFIVATEDFVMRHLPDGVARKAVLGRRAYMPVSQIDQLQSHMDKLNEQEDTVHA